MLVDVDERDRWGLLSRLVQHASMECEHDPGRTRRDEQDWGLKVLQSIACSVIWSSNGRHHLSSSIFRVNVLLLWSGWVLFQRLQVMTNTFCVSKTKEGRANGHEGIEPSIDLLASRIDGGANR